MFGLLAIKPRHTAVDSQSAEAQLMASRELIYTSCDKDLGTGLEPWESDADNCSAV